jgi:DNA-binding HxlR family transcriptional regulator
MSVLSVADWCDFTFLRDEVDLSDSALSKQLATLKKDGQIEQHRAYIGRVPKTTVRATDGGLQRFRDHVAALQAIADRTPPPSAP